jgi:hypothetical protein
MTQPAIIKVGTFTKGGCPIGWHLNAGGVPDLLTVKSNGDVLVGGVLMVELTEQRRQIIEQGS